MPTELTDEQRALPWLLQFKSASGRWVTIRSFADEDKARARLAPFTGYSNKPHRVVRRPGT